MIRGLHKYVLGEVTAFIDSHILYILAGAKFKSVRVKVYVVTRCVLLRPVCCLLGTVAASRVMDRNLCTLFLYRVVTNKTSSGGKILG